MSHQIHEYALYFTGAAASAAATIAFLKPHAGPLGLVDLPDARKQHGESVPLVGGIAVAFAVVLTNLATGIEGRVLAGAVVAAIPLLVVGLLDDRLGLTAKQRFGAQIAAALILVFGAKVVVSDLGALFGSGPLSLGWAAAPFTVICVVGIVNAYNMTDGVDGLAGSVCLVSVFALGAASMMVGAHFEMAAAVVLAGAIAGFLVFNLPHPWRPFRVFLGDAGSTFIGFSVVWLAIVVTQRQGPALYPIAAVWVLGLPLLDMGATLLRRLNRGVSPFAPDRTHLHHLLLDRGMSPSRIVLVEVASASVLAAVGIIGWRAGVPEWTLTVGFIGIATTYLFVITTIENGKGR